MHKITKQGLALEAAKRWAAQYGVTEGIYDGTSVDEQAEKLFELGDSATPEKVAQIIGNISWTNLTCNECDSDNQDEVWQVGEPMDYESQTADLCKACVEKLAAMG